MSKPIIVPPFNTKHVKFIEDGTDYLYIHPTHIRIVGRGSAEDIELDEKLPSIKTWDYDITIPKDKITSITLGFAPNKDCYIVSVENASGGGTDLPVKDRASGKELLNRILLWYFNPEEYFKEE